MAHSETAVVSGVRPRAHADDEDADRDRIDEQEDESFPASDPHSDWAGSPPDSGSD